MLFQPIEINKSNIDQNMVFDLKIYQEYFLSLYSEVGDFPLVEKQ